MLFWIAIFMFVMGLAILYVELETCCTPNFGCIICAIFVAVGLVASIFFTAFGVVAKFDAGEELKEKQTRYESLLYRYEHETDIVKRAEVITEIAEWNEDVAWGRKNQNNFWFGFMVPDIYDDLEHIELKEE